MFYGSMVALVTPFKNNAIDYPAVEALLEFHIASGTSAIVVAGTTGESATLRPDEKEQLIAFVINKVNERLPVIAGTGHQSTEETIAATNQALQLGAHAALIMTPAYIKPTQTGLVRHYESIAKAVPIPIIVYNVPSRTACDCLPETLAQLRHYPNIIGVKEASGDVQRVAKIRKLCDETIDIYSGEDALCKDMILQGAKGVISVTANVAPVLMSALCQAALQGQAEDAEKIDSQLALLHKALFVESNPIPVKWALAEMGYVAEECRLPLLPLSPSCHATVREAMLAAKIPLPDLTTQTGTE